MDKVLKSSYRAKNQNTEIRERRENDEHTWQTRTHRVTVEFGSTLVGQAIMMQFEKFVWTLEKTATWISNSKTDSRRPLIRPLPWILFLPALIVMRYTRIMLSLISICCGFDEIEASTMVVFLQQSRRHIRQIVNEAQRKRVKETQQCSIDYIRRVFLSVVSNLLKLISPTSDSVKVHNNKTSLNAYDIDETAKFHEGERDDKVSSYGDDTDSEDQAYQDFLSRTITMSDTDDEDYVYELNDTSDTDSQSSVASENLSDYETHKSAETIFDEKMKKNGSTANAASDFTTNETVSKLIVDTNAPTEPVIKDFVQNRSKNMNRHHKNGRFHGKGQNNGKQFNGAHTQAKNKTTKYQHQDVKPATDFDN